MRNLNYILEEQKMTTVELAKLMHCENETVVSGAKDLATKMSWALPHLRVRSEWGAVKALNLNKTQTLALASQLAPERLVSVIGRWKELESLRPDTFNEAEHAMEYLVSKLKDQATIIQTCKSELGIEDGYTARELAAELDLNPTSLDLMLADWKVQHRVDGCWMLADAYQGLGLVAEASPLDDHKFDCYLKWTIKGRKFIYDHFSKDNYVQPTSSQKLKLFTLSSSIKGGGIPRDALIDHGLWFMPEPGATAKQGGKNIS